MCVDRLKLGRDNECIVLLDRLGRDNGSILCVLIGWAETMGVYCVCAGWAEDKELSVFYPGISSPCCFVHLNTNCPIC